VAAFGIVPFVAFSTFVPLYGREIGLTRVGPVFVVASISIAVARLVFGKVPDRIGPVRTCTIALAFTAAGALVVSAWGAPVGVFVAAAVLAGGMALQTPSLIPAAVHGVPPAERASALATFTMFMDVSVALTGPVFGLVAGRAGYRTTFLTSGVCAAAALVVLRRTLAPRWRHLMAVDAESGAAGASVVG
jgi:MFS family permease